jgi:hypothetical protein
LPTIDSTDLSVDLAVMNSMAQSQSLQKRCDSPLNTVELGRQRRPLVGKILLVWIFLAATTNATDLMARIGNGELAVTPIAMRPVQPATFRSVVKGYRSGVRAPLQMVARSQSEWDALWRQHAFDGASSRPAPAIDFDREIVVALFLGDKPTGGYDVRISRADQTHDTLTIHYQERTPPPGALVSQAWTQPFHIVRIIGEVNSAVVFRPDS